MRSATLNYLQIKDQIEAIPLDELAAWSYPIITKKLERDYKGTYFVSYLDEDEKEYSFKTRSLKTAIEAYNNVNDESYKRTMKIK